MGARFARVNLADTATLTTTSGTMLRALTELQKPWARGLARGPENGSGISPATLVIRADLGTSYQLSFVGLVGLNDAAATADLAFSNVSAGASDAGTGSASNSGTNGTTHGNALWWRDSLVTARYVEISVSVFGLPSGFRHVDARRLLIMRATDEGTHYVQLSDGVDFDWSVETVDLSSSTTTARGGIFVSSQGSYRRVTYGVTGMTAAEAASLGRWLSLCRGKEEVAISLRDYGEVDQQSDETIYGRLLEWSPIQHTGGDTYACERIVVQEVPYPAL